MRDSGLIAFKCSGNALVVLILMPLARDLLADWQVQRSRLIYDRHLKNIGATVPARTAGLGQLSALAVVVGHLVPHNVRHCCRAIVME